MKIHYFFRRFICLWDSWLLFETLSKLKINFKRFFLSKMSSLIKRLACIKINENIFLLFQLYANFLVGMIASLLRSLELFFSFKANLNIVLIWMISILLMISTSFNLFSRTLPIILADLSIILVWMVSILVLISTSCCILHHWTNNGLVNI